MIMLDNARVSMNWLVMMMMLAVLGGCTSVKPASSKSTKKLFDTFFVGEAGTQYYIRPLVFTGQSSDEELLMDITFKYKDQLRDSATINFSIEGASAYKSFDSFALSTDEIELSTNDVDLLFTEIGNKGYVSRFSSRFSLKEVKQLFNKGTWVATVTQDDRPNRFKAHKKTSSAIEALRDNLFSIM